MDPIASFSGLASGIQWQDMIDQIMKLEASRTVTPLANRVSTQESRIEAWKAYEGLVSKLKSASLSLRDGTSFGIYSATAGTTAAGRGLISATASSSASPGSYRVEVIQLARAEKLNGRSEASTTTALGLTGQFFVNGRAVDIAATDTLNDVRDRINAVNGGSSASGVTATILTTGPSAHRLILTADQTGSRGIELVDSASGGGVLEQLGILDDTRVANVSPTDSARVESQRFASSAGKLATMLGVSPMPAQTTIRINGQKIDVDLANDTIIDVMNRVVPQDAVKLVQETVGGRTQYRLSVEGTVQADASATDPANSQRVVELLGFERSGRPGEITAGTDAVASIDGFRVSRRTNVISDAIAGVSINLLAADTTGRTASATGGALAVTVDPKSISAGTYAVNFEATSERAALASGAGLAIAAQPGVDSGTIADGSYDVAFTTTVNRTTTADPGLAVTAAPPSVAAGTYSVEATVTRTQSGTNPALTATIAGSSVAAGSYAAELTTTRSASSTFAGLTVTAAAASVPQGTHTVDISAAASRAATGTTLTFSSSYNTNDSVTILDQVSGNSASVSLTSGETLAQVVDKMNTAFASNGVQLTAVDNGGKLELRGNDYGSAAKFTVTTSANRVTNSIGIGSTTGVTYSGTDAAGSIGGVALSGSGQTLSGTGAYAGLSLVHTATAPASGSVTIDDTVTATINGAAASWDGAGTLTGADGLVLAYSGTVSGASLGSPATTSLGTVTLTDGVTGTIGGVAAAWDGASRTFTAPDGLAVEFTGAHPAGTLGSPAATTLGSVSVVDTTEITGGTIGGEAATWDALSGTLTAGAGTSAEGLSLAYSGPATSGTVGSVDVSTTTTLDGVTIGGEIADWDAASGVIRGRAGSRFEGLEISYSGPASYPGSTQPGHVGDLLIEGEIGVDLTIARDTGSTVGAVEAYVEAFNGIRDFVAKQQSSGDVLGTNGTLRTSARSLTEVMLSDVEGLSGSEFTRAAHAGVALDRDGRLTIDKAALTTALERSPNDVRALFGEVGSSMFEATDSISAAFSGTAASQIRFLEESNATLATRIGDAEQRLEVRRQGLLRQYTQMETMIAQVQSQGNWLSQQIASLQGAA